MVNMWCRGRRRRQAGRCATCDPSRGDTQPCQRRFPGTRGRTRRRDRAVDRRVRRVSAVTLRGRWSIAWHAQTWKTEVSTCPTTHRMPAQQRCKTPGVAPMCGATVSQRPGAGACSEPKPPPPTTGERRRDRRQKTPITLDETAAPAERRSVALPGTSPRRSATDSPRRTAGTLPDDAAKANRPRYFLVVPGPWETGVGSAAISVFCQRDPRLLERRKRCRRWHRRVRRRARERNGWPTPTTGRLGQRATTAGRNVRGVRRAPPPRRPDSASGHRS